MIKELDLADDAAWKQRFRCATIKMSCVARANPERGLVSSNRSGVYQLYAWDVPSGRLTQLTHTPEGRFLGYLSPDGRYVYYLKDRQGNEIGHFVRVPFAGGAEEDITPDLPPYASSGLTINGAGDTLALTAGTEAGLSLYILPLTAAGDPGQPRWLYHSESFSRGLALSYDGDTVVIALTANRASPHYGLLAFDVRSGRQIASLWEESPHSMTPVSFSPLPGDARLLATTDCYGADTLLLWDPRRNARTDLHFEGITGSVEGLDWADDGQTLLFGEFRQAVLRLYTYHLATQTLTALRHPPCHTFPAPYFGPGDEIYLPTEDATHPLRLISLDARTGAEGRTLLAPTAAPAGRPWESSLFPSSDGEVIQGWLGVPEGAGPFPTIIEMHGGPEGMQTETFEPAAQAWLDHGFAYFSVNYRGSTTFGESFRTKIWGNLGHWEVEDLIAARAYLIERGIAQADAVFLTGWSYGGYLTLQALGMRPHLWAGGMAGIAIADWGMMYAESAPPLRAYQETLLGGSPEEKPAEYRASSPITYVEHVAAPVLIIQGRNDTRTPPRPIEVYVARLQELGKPVELHWFDAGHLGPFTQSEQAIQHQEWMLRFAYRVLQKTGS